MWMDFDENGKNNTLTMGQRANDQVIVVIRTTVSILEFFLNLFFHCTNKPYWRHCVMEEVCSL